MTVAGKVQKFKLREQATSRARGRDYAGFASGYGTLRETPSVPTWARQLQFPGLV